ncbi:MAG: hypothetical protein AB1806_15315 [Acidobacteriota bacterium]
MFRRDLQEAVPSYSRALHAIIGRELKSTLTHTWRVDLRVVPVDLWSVRFA